MNSAPAGRKEVNKMYDTLSSLFSDKLGELFITEILSGLIAESDLNKVVCCLDMIAKESGRNVALYNSGVREYTAYRQWHRGVRNEYYRCKRP